MIGAPPKLVSVTREGVQRIPNSQPGYVYPVDAETVSVCGTYIIVHVRDANGAIWTLGKDQYALCAAPN